MQTLSPAPGTTPPTQLFACPQKVVLGRPPPCQVLSHAPEMFGPAPDGGLPEPDRNPAAAPVTTSAASARPAMYSILDRPRDMRDPPLVCPGLPTPVAADHGPPDGVFQ